MSLAAISASAALRSLCRRVFADRRGLAMMEFAYMAPVVIAGGGYGAELSNYALTQLRVSQYALNLADNASRVGVYKGAGVTQLREGDINDVLNGVRLQGEAINLTTHGRITLSSLENYKFTEDTAAVQRIHWQRCLGLKSGADYASHYGTANILGGTADNSTARGTPRPQGMGEPGATVSAMEGSGVMFVEINYDYQRLFGDLFMAPRTIRYVASFIIRDNRDLTQIVNPAGPKGNIPALSTCDKFSA